MAICMQCEHLGHTDFVNDQRDFLDIWCKNPDLPITNFIYGRKEPNILNPKGNCKGFKEDLFVPKSESIYELKEDEELAKTE